MTFDVTGGREIPLLQVTGLSKAFFVYKANLSKQISKATGKPLSVATAHSRLMAIKAFFKFLAEKPSYKSRISFADCEYFNPSANDARIAKTSRERAYPSLEQIKHVLKSMPMQTDFQRRDQAIIATALLTGELKCFTG